MKAVTRSIGSNRRREARPGARSAIAYLCVAQLQAEHLIVGLKEHIAQLESGIAASVPSPKH